MEDLNDIIQFTAIGSYKRSAVYAFADFLGYQEQIAINPNQIITNPLSKVEYVQEHIKKLLIDTMAKMNLLSATQQAELQYQEELNQLQAYIQNEVAIGMDVTIQIQSQS